MLNYHFCDSKLFKFTLSLYNPMLCSLYGSFVVGLLLLMLFVLLMLESGALDMLGRQMLHYCASSHFAGGLTNPTEWHYDAVVVRLNLKDISLHPWVCLCSHLWDLKSFETLNEASHLSSTAIKYHIFTAGEMDQPTSGKVLQSFKKEFLTKDKLFQLISFLRFDFALYVHF